MSKINTKSRREFIGPSRLFFCYCAEKHINFIKRKQEKMFTFRDFFQKTHLKKPLQTLIHQDIEKV